MKDITLMKPFMYLFIMLTIYNPVSSKTNSTMSNGQFFQYKYLDGLSSNFIFDIEKDQSGRIWVATQNGLTVIGGQNFIKYSVNDSLPSSDIIDITFFNDEVYVATSTDGIFTFNGDYFERVKHIQGKKISYMNKVGNSLFISTDIENLIYNGSKVEYMGWGFPKGEVVDVSSYVGETWYAGKKNIIQKESNNKFKNYELDFSDKKIVIQCILHKDNMIYIGTNKGLYSWGKNKKLTLEERSLNVVSLEYFNSEIILVGTKKGIYSLQDGQLNPITSDDSYNGLLSNVHIKNIKVINNHEIWYSTFGQGILYHDPTSFYNIGKKDGLDVGGMVYDAEYYNGSIYIGTNNGLFILNRDYSFIHLDKKNGLPSNKIMDLEINNDGVIYMATTKGLSVYTNGNFTNYSKKNGLPSNLLLSLLIDKKDNEKIWLGSKSAGVALFDGKNFITYSKKDGLPTNWIQDIKQKKDGTIIFACYGYGISIFNGKTFRNYNQGLVDNRVVTLAVDNRGEIWAGTESAGLALFSNENFSLLNTADGLGHNETFSLLSDNDNIWVGTFGGGVSYLNDDQWFTLDTKDGLIGNTVGSIARLKDESFFIGCDNGVTIFTPNENQIKLEVERVEAPQIDIIADEIVNGRPGERFSIYINPIYYSAGDSYFNYRTRINDGNVSRNWSELFSSPTIEYIDGYKEFMIEHEPMGVGKYVLEIQAVNNKLNTSNIVEVPFAIVRVWYLNPITAIPFWLAILGFGIFSSTTFVNYRKQKIKTKELQDAEMERQNAELEEAREFQQSLLPNEMPISDDYEIIGFQKTATEVGGDYFDFIDNGDGRIIAICGDATGHGLTSGNVVAITKTALSSIQLDDPISILDTLNKTLLRMNIGLNRMCLNIADISNDKIIFSSAGMPPAYFYSSQDETLKEIMVGALPLGSFSKSIHTSEEIVFKNKGDTLVLLSDGLPEAENQGGEMIGYEKTEEEIKSLINLNVEEIKNGLVKLCESWLGDIDLKDDMTLVIIKKK